MQKIIATLDGSLIKDWPTFHAQSSTAFGFPKFYGATMDAWVDCLSYLRDEDSMSTIQLGPDQILQIDILNADVWRRNQSEILEEVLFCIAGINERYEDYGEPPALAVNLL
jgi:hypothetical protein